MISPPDLSIIIPVYNVDKYLSKCLDSVLSQKNINYEIIIINDGSKDDSGNICEKYAKNNNQIVLINQENKGLSESRNIGVEISNGKYVGFIDSDDFIEEDMFSHLYEMCISDHTEISVCGYYIHDINGLITEKNSVNDKIIFNNNIEAIKYCINSDNINAWNKLYKKQLFENIKYPKGKIYEDVFTTTLLLEKSKSIAISSQPKYHYINRNNSISNGMFSVSDFDLGYMYINRYEYFRYKYNDYKLDMLNIRDIFSGFLYILNKAYISDSINKYKIEINLLINSLRIYDFSNCNFKSETIRLLQLIFNDLRNYIIFRKGQKNFNV
jgi:glycosyltransferase involved in cell wall biosynthesis